LIWKAKAAKHYRTHGHLIKLRWAGIDAAGPLAHLLISREAKHQLHSMLKFIRHKELKEAENSLSLRNGSGYVRIWNICWSIEDRSDASDAASISLPAEMRLLGQEPRPRSICASIHDHGAWRARPVRVGRPAASLGSDRWISARIPHGPRHAHRQHVERLRTTASIVSANLAAGIHGMSRACHGMNPCGKSKD
jgi:hypothetical protein